MRLARKKGAQLQLQAELNTDDEWVKFIDKEGLIVVDIYSEWCGPCLGMVGNLKKLKVEVGGDNLHLAIARSDGIECLKRFRNKSEPTWMFIAGGFVVNIMFGANAPKLTKLIVEELENELQAQKGERERIQIPFEQLTTEEQMSKDLEDKRLAEIYQVEEEAEKVGKVERRQKRCDAMAPYVSDLTVLLFWPHCIDGHKQIYELWDPLGITVADRESVKMTEDQFRKLFFGIDDILNNPQAFAKTQQKSCLAILLKKLPEKGKQGTTIVDDVSNAVYGQDETKSEKTQTGDDEANDADAIKCVADRFKLTTEDGTVIPGLFTPRNAIERSAAMDAIFQRIIGQFLEPEAPPVPPHLAIIFDSFKRREVLETCQEYKDDVLKTGFFSSDDPEVTKNLAITAEEYETKHLQKEYNEKLVVMVAKTAVESAAITALQNLGPTFVSKNTIEGEQQCIKFFPPGYGVPPPQKIAKSKRRRGKKKLSEKPSTDKPDTDTSEKQNEEEVEKTDKGDKEDSDAEVGELDEADHGDDESTPDAEDKATSPLPE